MKSISLNVFPRTLIQRNQVKKVRAGGRVPAVIYGSQIKPQPLEVSLNDLEKLTHGSGSENILVDLVVAGDERPKRLALVQEVQHHPLTGKILHLDFHEVAEDEKVTITVPVETAGEAVGVKNGGVLERVLFKLKVRALPKDLPEIIAVDVTGLQIGQTLHIGEIPSPEGVEILGDKKIPVFSVAEPPVETEEAPAAAAEGITEPEVIKEKKEGEEAGAEGEGAKPAAGAAKGAEKPAEKKAEKKK